MAHRIALITDSTCDIPDHWLEQYSISVVPMTVIMGEEQFVDGAEITPREFYDRLINEDIHPSTSQPTPVDFTKAYQDAVDKGAEEILAFVISKEMSGTYASAVQAAEDFSLPVHVVNSRNNSMGLGWQVIAAARAREAGGGLKEMKAAAEHVRGRMAYFILLDTIEYLARGGRIGSAVKFMNSIINIKPIVYVRPDMGTVAPSLPARSRKSGMKTLYREFFKNMDPEKAMHITVLHNAAEEDAKTLEDKVRQEHDPQELFTTIVTPILGAHTGPHAVALCGYSE